MRTLTPFLSVPLLAAVTVSLAACAESGQPARFDDIGDASVGAALIEANGCGSCHIIPGIDGAEGLVGPPLNHMGHRIFIAGLLRNTPDNMVAWLRDPQEVVPGNAMPDMGLSESQAKNVTAYLYTLE
ncbi:cytochrome c family protein [Aurantimonas sp. VKM B-3413]|uniref:c-type cytochrome n=1 Tax=Aurantimonas sp. VKM B-3413 TaxID=2779401 RepID=UPI001E50216C|nr:c-type cytochrome [Aurantimonas sp. VKM B-3413]MCB8837142.1 c-type cytochrome [Aurantimonas sp. VKM B-3413]